MKKQIILGSFLALAGITYSQNSPTWPSTGNVGIGTTTPGDNLDIITTNQSGGITITKAVAGNGAAGLKLNNITKNPSNVVVGRNWGVFSLGQGDAGGAGNFAIYDLTSGINRLFIGGNTTNAGNVGIGTMSPLAKLDVNGNIKLSASSLGGSAIEMGVSGNPVGTTRYKVFGNGSTYIGNFSGITYNANSSVLTLGQATPGNKAISIINGTNPTGADIFCVYGDGTTYIGAGRPNAAGPVANAKLTVDGKVLAKDFYVAISAGAASTNYWADYVFNKDYKLMSLEKVKDFTLKQKHLPGVPSACELEQNGLNIAEMQRIQMEKIEELYLHVIKLNEKIENLEKENAELKK